MHYEESRVLVAVEIARKIRYGSGETVISLSYYAQL